MPDSINPQDLARLAFEVYEFLYPGGSFGQEVATASLGERVQRIRAGLKVEKEFFSMVSWLGRCAAIHGIDQSRMPVADHQNNLRAPDFLAVVQYGPCLVPVLIEVKSCNDDKLVWTDTYITSLRAFADALQLPLLVAWKRDHFWALVEVRHFEKNVRAHHLSFQKACQENLLRLLFGDVLVQLSEDFRFELEGLILDPTPETESGLLPEGTYTIKIQDAAFHVGNQSLSLSEIGTDYFWLFFACNDDNHVERVDRSRIRAIHYPKPDHVFSLFNVLVTQLLLRSGGEGAVNWDEEITKGPFPSCGSAYRESLRRGIDLGVVRYVFDQLPHTQPEFLPTGV